jgi:hypothetical protein
VENILFFGAAGCGKTTRLVNQLRKRLAEPHIKAALLAPDRAPEDMPDGLRRLSRSLLPRILVSSIPEAARIQLGDNGVQLGMATPVIERQAAKRALGPYAHARADKFLATTVRISRLDPDAPDRTNEHKILVSLYDEFLKSRSLWNPTDLVIAACERIESGLIERPLADLIVVDDAHALNHAELRYVKANVSLGAELLMAFDDMQSIDETRIESGLDGVMAMEEAIAFKVCQLSEQYRLSPKAANLLEKTREESALSLRNDAVSANACGSSQIEWFVMDTPLEQISVITKLVSASTATIVPWRDEEINLLEAALVVDEIPYFRTDGQSVLGMPVLKMMASALDAIIDPSEITVFGLLIAISTSVKKNAPNRHRISPADLSPMIDHVIHRAKLAKLGMALPSAPIDDALSDYEDYVVDLFRNLLNWMNLKEEKRYAELISVLFEFAMDHNPGVDAKPLSMLLEPLATGTENLHEIGAQLTTYLDCNLPSANEARENALRISTLADLRGRHTEALLIPFVQIDQLTDMEKRKIAFAAGKASDACIFFLDKSCGQDVTNWFHSTLGAPACLS